MIKQQKEEEMKVIKFGINMILVLICMSALSIVACKKKPKKKKENTTKVSKSERAQIWLQVTDLQERMQVVMETQGCIVQNCSSYYGIGSKQTVDQVNKKVVQVNRDEILSQELKNLSGRVNSIEEIHVVLLKSVCTVCAR